MMPTVVNPHAWMVGIPLALACFGFWRMPASSTAKAWLLELARYESLVYSNLLLNPPRYCEQRAHRQVQYGTLALAGSASLFSAMSLGAFVRAIL